MHNNSEICVKWGSSYNKTINEKKEEIPDFDGEEIISPNTGVLVKLVNNRQFIKWFIISIVWLLLLNTLVIFLFLTAESMKINYNEAEMGNYYTYLFTNLSIGIIYGISVALI